MVFGYIGCNKDEKINGQYFYVSLDVSIGRGTGYLTDDLSETVNYSSMCKLVKDIVEKSRCNLIESLANEIADSILKTYKFVEEVFVIVSKPRVSENLGAHDIQVTIEKKRFHVIFLSLGTNIGNRYDNLKYAVSKFYMNGNFTDIKCSNVYETEPIGYIDQSSFYNMCLKCMTYYTPYELLSFTKNIEHEMHREKTIKNGPRVIDVDILLYDDLRISDFFLTIPHPRMYERAFVLVPLGELMVINHEVPQDQIVKKIGTL